MFAHLAIIFFYLCIFPFFDFNFVERSCFQLRDNYENIFLANLYLFLIFKWPFFLPSDHNFLWVSYSRKHFSKQQNQSLFLPAENIFSSFFFPFSYQVFLGLINLNRNKRQWSISRISLQKKYVCLCMLFQSVFYHHSRVLFGIK